MSMNIETVEQLVEFRTVQIWLKGVCYQSPVSTTPDEVRLSTLFMFCRLVDYCVDRYGQCPVYNNSLECNFGVVVHHVDPAFYEKYYNESGILAQIHEHMKNWH